MAHGRKPRRRGFPDHTRRRRGLVVISGKACAGRQMTLQRIDKAARTNEIDIRPGASRSDTVAGDVRESIRKIDKRRTLREDYQCNDVHYLHLPQVRLPPRPQ
jgi:hypothetical protein